MRKMKLFVFLFFIIPFFCFGENTGNSQTVLVKKRVKGEQTTRPKKPANIYFMVSYNEDGTWVFDLPANVEYLMVEVSKVIGGTVYN